jgi:NAD(P)-dependent dehydrogenase (short-subunit alcohol dehydrogenase family)
VHYGRSTQDAESLVAAILSQGGRADAIRANLGTAEGAILLAKEVGSIVADRLDVLVLNAGISKAARILDERRAMRKYLAGVNHLCFTPVAAQCTTFDGVIIAASMSSCAAKRSSLML